MKQYHCKGFQYADNMTAWLNKHQEINVINIIYLERNLSYQVFYYTEEDFRSLMNEI